MKLGVIADTHIPRSSTEIPGKVFQIFTGADLIIHAGDLTEEVVITQLEKLAPVIAVHGNRDSDYMKNLLPDSRIIKIAGFKFGVLHGHGDKGTTLDRLPEFFKGEALDCIIFGHSHIPYNQILGNTLYFNPGSPTMKKRQKKPSVGLLILEDNIKSSIEYF